MSKQKKRAARKERMAEIKQKLIVPSTKDKMLRIIDRSKEITYATISRLDTLEKEILTRNSDQPLPKGWFSIIPSMTGARRTVTSLTASLLELSQPPPLKQVKKKPINPANKNSSVFKQLMADQVI